MSHVTHEWVMSHTKESRHTWTSNVTHEWIMSHTHTRTATSWTEQQRWAVSSTNSKPKSIKRASMLWCLAGAWVMSHTAHKFVMLHKVSCHEWGLDALMSGSCFSQATHGWVMSHSSEALHSSMSYVAYQWGLDALIPGRCLTHVTHYESCHTWMSHADMDESCHMHEECHTRSHVTQEWRLDTLMPNRCLSHVTHDTRMSHVTCK